VECPELLAPTLRFLSAMNYYGLAEIEHKLLDVNARTWGFPCLGPSAGVDFSYLLFADQIGQPVQGGRGRPGVSEISEVFQHRIGFQPRRRNADTGGTSPAPVLGRQTGILI